MGKTALTSQVLFSKAKHDFQRDQQTLLATANQYSEERRAIGEWLDEIKRSARHFVSPDEAQQIEMDLREVREYRADISKMLNSVRNQLKAITQRRRTLWEIAKEFEGLEVRARQSTKRKQSEIAEDAALRKVLRTRLTDENFFDPSDLWAAAGLVDTDLSFSSFLEL